MLVVGPTQNVDLRKVERRSRERRTALLKSATSHLLVQEAASIAHVAKDTGLTCQTVCRIRVTLLVLRVLWLVGDVDQVGSLGPGCRYRRASKHTRNGVALSGTLPEKPQTECEHEYAVARRPHAR
jgi:hypothetical protein